METPVQAFARELNALSGDETITIPISTDGVPGEVTFTAEQVRRARVGQKATAIMVKISSDPEADEMWGVVWSALTMRIAEARSREEMISDIDLICSLTKGE